MRLKEGNYSLLGCGSPDYKQDGVCDDENNNAECQYDGGDCCGDNVDTSVCTECQCLDPNYGSTGGSQGMKSLK